MRKVSRWIFFSGGVWFIIGFILLSKGINLSVYSLKNTHTPFISFLSHYTNSSQQAVMLLISIALLLGYIKGRFVLLKTVKRVVSRILELTPPIKLKDIYSRGYLILLSSMIFLGVLMRYLPIAQDIRGFVDLTIGAALMNGALLYFRFGFACRKMDQENQS